MSGGPHAQRGQDVCGLGWFWKLSWGSRDKEQWPTGCGLVDKRKEEIWAAWENGCTRSMGVSGDGKATRLVAQGTWRQEKEDEVEKYVGVIFPRTFHDRLSLGLITEATGVPVGFWAEGYMTTKPVGGWSDGVLCNGQPEAGKPVRPVPWSRPEPMRVLQNSWLLRWSFTLQKGSLRNAFKSELLQSL